MSADSSPKRPQRIGIFGGTFDPVHFGHLRPALEICESLELEVLRMLPCHLPTHRDQPGASIEQRIEMLRLACAGSPNLQIDDQEARRSSPSYTVDTLQTYKKTFPDAQLLFFMGMDAFAQFTHWYHWQDILTLAHLVVIARPGATVDGAEERLLMSRQCVDAAALEKSAGQILMLNVAQFDISATRIRAMVAENRDIRFLLPESVRDYIARERLYR